MKHYTEINRLYKSNAHRKITGVCAGLARYWDAPRMAVRIAAVVCLIALPVVTAVAYVTATLLLPSR
ncbi:PspC domain-containing protein [Paraglaciecola aquimarina]|uniref:PspC domain-containing protein n=1 Tax=Paraglaciecola aquimarina TaxID=1235557 RepID=A0ABU3ST66_9ALTE|nr:PspC domain-containing protein [Paraglaciecola aquimarina]MDU0353198.1 PspC domain-containing protein [Paraglaciecola aquimarina]